MEKLLELLKENARLTTKQLAAMLGESEKEIENQIAAYEKAGVIRGYRAVINAEKAGDTGATALIELKVMPQKGSGFDDTARRVMEFEEVESVYLMSGGYDLAVTVTGQSMQEVALFVAKRLAPLEGVLSTATHFILTRYKDAGIALESFERNDERRSNIL